MLRSGDRFGDYAVVRLLGKGGMGSVFLLETAEGGQVAAKILDPYLGIARGGVGGTETTVTQTGMMIGTPAYMAPEQMLDAHHVDSRADIYSLGIVFYEMLAGERPHPNDTVVQLMAKAVAGEPIPDVRTMRPEVSASLAELVSLMCAMQSARLTNDHTND